MTFGSTHLPFVLWYPGLHTASSEHQVWRTYFSAQASFAGPRHSRDCVGRAPGTQPRRRVSPGSGRQARRAPRASARAALHHRAALQSPTIRRKTHSHGGGQGARPGESQKKPFLPPRNNPILDERVPSVPCASASLSPWFAMRWPHWPRRVSTERLRALCTEYHCCATHCGTSPEGSDTRTDSAARFFGCGFRTPRRGVWGGVGF